MCTTIADRVAFVCRVLAEVTAVVAAPYPERPLEGFLTFNVEMTPLASPAVEVGVFRPPPAAVAIGRMLERAVRDARAVDVESLCIQPGQQVWNIRADVRILDDDGNAMDAAMLAAVAGLLHFRRPDVSMDAGGKAVIHSYSSRAPVPLAIHHVPVTLTFALFSQPRIAAAVQAAAPAPASATAAAAAASASASEEGEGEDVVLFDPCGAEEALCDGSMTFIMNAHKELCGMSKLGGCPLPARTITAAAIVAADKAVRLVAALRQAVADAEAAAAVTARERHAAAAGGGADVLAAFSVTADASASASASASHARGASTTAGVRVVVEADDNGVEEDEDDSDNHNEGEDVDVDGEADGGEMLDVGAGGGAGDKKAKGRRRRSIAATLHAALRK